MSDVIEVDFRKPQKQKLKDDDRIDWRYFLERVINTHESLKELPEDHKQKLIENAYHFLESSVKGNQGNLPGVLIMMNMITEAWTEIVHEVENSQE